jgi:glycosyltransferase involved in cell wall biosynthesis
LKPTLLIPIYDHGATIGGVVTSLLPHGLPILIVDDGSHRPTQRALAELADRHRSVSVLRRPANGGRGAALTTGYCKAFERGFTHAIQLDADGQHDAQDVPAFVAAIKRSPEALVLGAPRFDASAPRARLYGRQLSRAMVWLATLSFCVEDPLCGFRGIPLTATWQLLREQRLGEHMEFDPELVIALVRRGIEVVNLPTRVVYAEGGLSHFDMLRDNARLSGVYARALVTLPTAVPGAFRRLARGARA